MGSVSPPPGSTRPPTGRPGTGATPAGGTPPLAGPTQGTTTSRFHFQDKKVPMGPSGSAILLTIAAVAAGAWFYFKAPSSVGSEQLQMYAGYESNMEVVSLAMCAPPGCAAIYLTPTVGKSSMEALPGAVALADELRRQDVECYLVIGEEPVADAVKRARGLHRRVVLDPQGEWAKSSGIEKAPAWLVWRSGGKVVLRSEEAVSSSAVVSALR